uniref:Nuclear transcription factor Y subunit beta n=1 Tax=Macrostomum lignano TaxID=282301 RepID=A0A1I8GYR3_9PLAT
MKRTIPETGKITKEAKECVQECVSEFISFITSEASDRCQDDKRKTMNGEDILTAMQRPNERAGSAGASASASGCVNQDTPSAASSADASGAALPPSVVSAPTAVTLAGLENSNGQVVYR